MALEFSLCQFPFMVSLLLEPGWYETSDKMFGAGVNKEHNGRCENGEFTKESGYQKWVIVL